MGGPVLLIISLVILAWSVALLAGTLGSMDDDA